MQNFDLKDTDLFALRGIGLGEIRSASRLAAGANNEIFLVEFESAKCVLKKTLKSGVNRLGNELGILRMLNGICSPRVLWAGSEVSGGLSNALLMEYVDGTPLFEVGEREAAALGLALKAVHSVETASSKVRLDRSSWEEYFQTRLLTQLEFARKKAPDSLCKEMEGLLGNIKKLGSKLESLGVESAKVLVHTDLIPLNVFIAGKECKIIDWELGRTDFPEWDLCSVEKAFRFTKESREIFYKAYQRNWNPDRLKLVSLLQYSNVALWRMCSFYCRGENQSIQEKFLRELDEEIQWIRENLS